MKRLVNAIIDILECPLSMLVSSFSQAVWLEFMRFGGPLSSANRRSFFSNRQVIKVEVRPNLDRLRLRSCRTMVPLALSEWDVRLAVLSGDDRGSRRGRARHDRRWLFPGAQSPRLSALGYR